MIDKLLKHKGTAFDTNAQPYEYEGYHYYEMGDKINELVDAVNKLTNVKKLKITISGREFEVDDDRD